MSTSRRMAAFRGALQGPVALGPGRWLIEGTERERGEALRAYLCADAPPGDAKLPADAELWQVAEGRYELRSGADAVPLAATSLQLHREPAQGFRDALPPAAVPWRMRATWWLLLSLLRLPGAARLLPRGGRDDAHDDGHAEAQ